MAQKPPDAEKPAKRGRTIDEPDLPPAAPAGRYPKEWPSAKPEVIALLKRELDTPVPAELARSYEPEERLRLTTRVIARVMHEGGTVKRSKKMRGQSVTVGGKQVMVPHNEWHAYAPAALDLVERTYFSLDPVKTPSPVTEDADASIGAPALVYTWDPERSFGIELAEHQVEARA